MTSRSCCFASAQYASRTAQVAGSAPAKPTERHAARGGDSAQRGGLYSRRRGEGRYVFSWHKRKGVGSLVPRTPVTTKSRALHFRFVTLQILEVVAVDSAKVQRGPAVEVWPTARERRLRYATLLERGGAVQFECS